MLLAAGAKKNVVPSIGRMKIGNNGTIFVVLRTLPSHKRM